MAYLVTRTRVVFASLVAAHPDFYAQTPISDVVGFQPGGAWGVMGIEKFEVASEGNCELSTDVPSTGFTATKNYSVTVTSAWPGGVAHIVWPSAGLFVDAAPGKSIPVHTHLTEVFANKDWIWTSPAAADNTDVVLYAICATEYLAKAYFVPLKLERAPAPTPPPSGTCPTDAREQWSPHACTWEDGVDGFDMPTDAQAYCDYFQDGYFGYSFSGEHECAPSARRAGNYCLWDDGKLGVTIPAGASADCSHVSEGRIGFVLPALSEAVTI